MIYDRNHYTIRTVMGYERAPSRCRISSILIYDSIECSHFVSYGVPGGMQDMTVSYIIALSFQFSMTIARGFFVVGIGHEVPQRLSVFCFCVCF